MRIQSCLAVALLALACTSLTDPPNEPSSRVEPEGTDHFKVSYSSLWGVPKARAAAIDEANRFCGTRNALMVPDSEKTPQNESPSFEFVFHCEPERDPR
jgi:hypothetical protein